MAAQHAAGWPLAHVGCGDVAGELARRLAAVVALRTLKRFLARMSALVQVQLVLVLEGFPAVAADVGLALHVDQFVEPQRVRRLESLGALVTLVRPRRAVRLLVGKQVELVGKLCFAHVTLVRLSTQVNLLVHFHACKVGELLSTKSTSEKFL